MRRQTRLLLLVFFGPSPALGAEYYVDADRGSDAWSGTLEQPWETLSHALSIASPVAAGDTVWAHGGEYRETVVVGKSGNATDGPVTIAAYADEVPVLNGAAPLAGWTKATADDPYLTVTIGAGTYFHPQYASIYWTRVPAGQFPDTLDDTVLLEQGEHARVASWPDQSDGFGEDPTEFSFVHPDCYDQDVFLYDTALTQETGFWEGKPGYWDPPVVRTLVYARNNNVTERTVGSHALLTDYGQITLSEPLEYDLSGAGNLDDGYRIINHPRALDSAGEFFVSAIESYQGQDYRRVYFWPTTPANLDSDIGKNDLQNAFVSGSGGGNHVIIDGFTMIGYAGHTISFSPAGGGSHLTIRNCAVYNGSGHGIYLARMDDSVLESTVIRRCADRGAIVIDSDHFIMRGNDSRENGSTNLSYYGATNSMMIANTVGGQRTAHGNGTSCYGVDSMVENVLLANNTYLACNSSFQNVRNVTLFGNVYHVDDDHMAWPINNWPRAHGLMGHDGYFFYANNTIYDSRYDATGELYHAVNLRSAADDYGPTGSEDGPVATWYLYNNILHGIAGHQEEDWGNGSPRRRVHHDYNLHTWYMWQQRSSYDWALGPNEAECLLHDAPNGDAANCALTDVFFDPVYAAGNWRPSADSPVRGTGREVQSLIVSLGIADTFPEYDFTKDFSGLAWDDPPSMGAFEYGECGNGYVDTGVECVDVDECVAGTHQCHQHATCTNIDGAYVCECAEGYAGDGRVCTAEPSGTVRSGGCDCDGGKRGSGMVRWCLVALGVGVARRLRSSHKRHRATPQGG